ncbi:MAG: hypothetical protein H7259_07330 [Cytophagales bacterium]|nr:hypothetical protein [Cytophaga sp.]
MTQLQLDKPTIQSYGVALSGKLTDEYFSSREIIKGDEIVRFTDIEQLNFFILMNLFDRWKEEIVRLKSPYFNYEDQEVALALKTFVNKVSRHIAVRKEFFKPLVQKAIVDTLTYLLNPIEFIEQEFGRAGTISVTDLQEKQKFFKLHKDSFQQWLDAVSGKYTGAFQSKEAIEEYKRTAPRHHAVLYSDPVVDKFNQLLKLTIQIPSPQQATVDKLVKTMPSEPSLKKEESAVTTSAKPGKDSDNTVNGKFSKQQLTINDSLKSTSKEGTSIAERLSKSKIEDIKSSIPLNMKFLFINVLFDGKAHEYNDALAQIEQCPDVASAQVLLIEKYGKKNQWDTHKEEMKEFFQIIGRKFY